MRFAGDDAISLVITSLSVGGTSRQCCLVIRRFIWQTGSEVALRIKDTEQSLVDSARIKLIPTP